MVELESSTSKVAQLQIGKSKYLIFCEKCALEHGAWSGQTNHFDIIFSGSTNAKLAFAPVDKCFFLWMNKAFFRMLKPRKKKFNFI